MYWKLWNENPPVIKRSSINVQTYTGEKLEILGKIHVYFVNKKERGLCTLVVVKEDGVSLIG